MSLRHLAVLLVGILVLSGCGDDDPAEDAEPLVEPQASVGESFLYRGAVDTDAEWELTVVVHDVDCDVDVGDEADVDTGQERLCVVHLDLENTGAAPNIEPFSQASALLGDDGSIYPAVETVTGLLTEERGLEPLVGLEPGGSAEGLVAFSVPEDVEPTYLRLQAGAEDEWALVELDG